MNNRQRQEKKRPAIVTWAAAWVGMGAAFLLLLCLSAFWPSGPVRANVARSIPGLLEETMYPCFGGFKLFQMDNYTDTIMLYEAAQVGDRQPVRDIFDNLIYTTQEDPAYDWQQGMALDLRRCLEGDTQGMEPFSYSRYWHGYLVLLRPLLMVMTYQQIRVLNYCLLLGLFGLLTFKVARKLGRETAILFAISQLAVALPLVPYNLQFSWTFYIAYGASLSLLVREEHWKTRGLPFLLFLVGGTTAFLDLLVTPIITLGLPVILGLEGKAQTLWEKLKAVVLSSLAWGAGYASIWALKWIMAGWVTGRNVIGDAVSQAGVRTATQWKGMDLTLPSIAGYLLEQLASRGLLWPLVGAMLAVLVGWLLLARDKRAVAGQSWLLLTALMAPAWFLLLKEHSIHHGWYTWRAMMPTVFAALLFLKNTCSLGQAKRRVKGWLSHGQ